MSGKGLHHLFHHLNNNSLTHAREQIQKAYGCGKGAVRGPITQELRL